MSGMGVRNTARLRAPEGAEEMGFLATASAGGSRSSGFF